MAREISDTQCDDCKRLRAALAEIAKGEGAFKVDPLAFAHSVIENLITIAEHALGEKK